MQINHISRWGAIGTCLMLTLSLVWPRLGSAQDGEVIEFAETEIFFEFNSTDLDLGIHIFFDAQGWENVKVSGPDGTIFNVTNDGSLKQIGSTEVFTESAEPPLDEENLEAEMAAFLALFPEGEYAFEGTTIEGGLLTGTAMLSHDLPAAPGLVFPDPEAEENVADPDDTVIEWSDTSEAGDPVIERYHVVVEFQEAETERVFVFSVDVPANPGAATQSMTVAPEFFENLEGLEGEFKAEVVAIAGDKNATIVENEFELGSEPEPEPQPVFGDCNGDGVYNGADIVGYMCD